MIFIALGTQDKPFVRLLKLAESLNTKEEIIVQSGYTKYSSNKMTIYDYLDKEDYYNYINKASFVICHGGVGTILSCFASKKKVIVVPRLKKYGEHQNDHQLQVASIFAKNGNILLYKDGDDFNKLVKKVKGFKPKKYVSNNDNFISKLKDYLEL